jgi:two-component system NarL family response regulator
MPHADGISIVSIDQKAQGNAPAAIAADPSIAPGTVWVHVHAILQKLDVCDRTEALILLMSVDAKGLDYLWRWP